VKGELFSTIEGLIGYDGAQQLMAAIENITVFEPTLLATVLSIGVLIFTSTTVLVTMQNALNKIFRVEPKPQGWGLIKMARDRAISLTLLIGFAFILLLSFVVDSIITAFSTYLEEWFGGINIGLTLFTSIMVSFLITTLLLASIFKFLPDTTLKWRHTWFGAILTSILFSLGKYLISFYIGNSNIGGIYDAAGDILVIMAWIFYTSLIFMFGAVFTYTRVRMMGESIPASDYVQKIGENKNPD
jgi:membrane protein